MESIGFMPIDNRVLIQPTDPAQSKGGIIIPDGARDGRSYMGVVLAVGPGKPIGQLFNTDGAIGPIEYRRATEVRPGDIVFYTEYGSHPMTWEGRTYRVAAEDDLLGYFPNPQRGKTDGQG